MTGEREGRGRTVGREGRRQVGMAGKWWGVGGTSRRNRLLDNDGKRKGI